MVTMAERNRVVTKNAKAMEDVASMLIGAPVNPMGVYDIKGDGIAIEVKSCQERILDSGRSPRFGRFNLHSVQHMALLQNNGEYLFMVHSDRKIIRFVRVSAKDLDKVVTFSNGRTSVSWKRLFAAILSI